MTDAGFFKGTSADQDSRFSDKNKKLMKTLQFADNLDKKVIIYNKILSNFQNIFCLNSKSILIDWYEKSSIGNNETVYNK